jgi:hypothetical protein
MAGLFCPIKTAFADKNGQRFGEIKRAIAAGMSGFHGRRERKSFTPSL